MIIIPYEKLSVVHHYCNKKISPRQYYFHNAFGGDGWDITRTEMGRNKTEWVLKTNETEHETYIALRFL